MVPLLGTSGFKFRLISIELTLTSFIYALRHTLVTSPNFRWLLKKGIISLVICSKSILEVPPLPPLLPG